MGNHYTLKKIKNKNKKSKSPHNFRLLFETYFLSFSIESWTYKYNATYG